MPRLRLAENQGGGHVAGPSRALGYRICTAASYGNINRTAKGAHCATFIGVPDLKETLLMIPGELISEYRTRLALQQSVVEDRRRAELSELTATENTPTARIRAWERTHGLTLPRGAAHPVLNSVAAATSLTIEQVRDEQSRRLLPVASAI